MATEKLTFYTENITVNPYECDIYGRWKPTAFFQRMSSAAGAHAEKLGFGFNALRENNVFWVLSRVKLAIYSYPQQYEQIRLRTWPKTYQQKLFFIRDFQLFNERDCLIAAASSAWVVIDGSTRRLVPPQKLEGLRLPNTPGEHGLDEPLEKIALPDGGEERFRQKVRYSDLDEVGHMNNGRYVERICDAFELQTYEKQEMAWIQINFDKETRYNEELAVFRQPMGDEDGLFGIKGLNLSTNARAFEALVKFCPINITLGMD